MSRKTRVAFVCTHNACRSQIAEAVARLRAGDVIEPFSAGTDPATKPDPDAVRLLEEHGADVSRLRSKSIDEIPAPDIVITMGCGVNCPSLPCRHREDWGLEDPTGRGNEALESCLLTIEKKVDALAERLRSRTPGLGAEDIAALRALADETRLAIVALLAPDKEVCACKLLEQLPVSQSTLSHHMKALVETGLASQRREGRWSHYKLEPERFAHLGRVIASLGKSDLGAV